MYKFRLGNVTLHEQLIQLQICTKFGFHYRLLQTCY